MNIVFVSSEFPLDKNQATGGIGTYLLNITEGLKKQGHQVTVITKGDRYRDQDRGINVVLCNYGSGICVKLRKILTLSLVKRLLNFIEYPLLFSLGVYLEIKKIEREQKIDLIEGNDFGGELFFYLLLSRKHPPVVLQLHTPSFIIQKFNQEPLTLFYCSMKFLEVYCLKKADSLYSPTRSLGNIVSQEINRPIKTIIPYPFQPLYKKLKKIKRKSNLILYVGKLQPKKGIFLLTQTIPQVVNKLPNTQFYFVGPDTLHNGVSVRSLLIKELKKLGVLKNVIFVGQIDKRKLYRLYKQSTVTVIPSLWENFPNVCLEAMSQGSVVIASSVGSLKEIIMNNDNGLLVKPGNEVSLSQAIIYLMANKILREKISRKSINWIRSEYNVERIIPLTLSFYKKIITRLDI